MTNIEQLKKETDEIKKGLAELKNNVSISEVEKKNKAEALKKQAEQAKQKIQTEINTLKDKTDDESKKKKEEAETLLNSFNETMNLYNSILNNGNRGSETSTTTPTTSTTTEGNPEEKGFFGKTGEWIGEQWSDVVSGDKRKEEPGKNVLRAVGFGLTGYAAYKGVKALWNWAFGDKEEEEDSDDEESEKKSKKKKKKKKDDEESSRWKKFLIGAGITVGTVVGGVEIYKHWNSISSRVKEKLGMALPFDEAKKKVEAEVRNGKIDDDHFGVFNAHFDGITYDENTQEICSYGQKTKIEKNGKKLQGMDNVEFASWEELIHAANIVNFTKRMMRGRGASSKPFSLTKWGGDLGFKCSATGETEFMKMNGGTEREWILGTLGTVGGGLLGGYCAGVHGAAIGAVGGGAGGYALGAYIDNNSSAGRCCGTIAKGANLDLFINYLNDQKDENGKSLRESGGEQHINPNETPINHVVDNGEQGSEWGGLLAEIENSYGDDQTGRRQLKIERDESKPEEYTISSYGHKLKINIEGGFIKKGEKLDYNKIKKIHIEKYEEYDSRGDGLDIDFPHTEEGLKEAIKTANLTNMIIEDWKGKGGEAYPFFWGKYTTPPSLDMDVEGFRGKTILSRDSAKKFPTLFEDLKKGSDGGFGSAIGYTKGHQTKMNDQAANDKSDGSQYIKFLHQIGKGKFWKKI